MPLSWNEIKTRAHAFSKEWRDVSSEEAEAKSFWDGLFNVFGISRRRVASFEEPVKKLGDKQGFIDLFWKGVLVVENKSRDEIFTVISEISILGMNGIDHTAAGKTYTLKAYTDETFSGIHLLCLKYVGFKLYDPAANCGLDFTEAYEMALNKQKAVLH
jgi:hypothetical protein